MDHARQVVAGVIRPTATYPSASLSEMLGRRLLFKPEHLQRTGSFKIRGAYNFMASLAAGTGQFGRGASEVVAASAGNHAQGVALAASLCGLRSTIFMPEGAPLPKVDATTDYGASILLGGSIVDDCIDRAKAYAAQTGAVFVPPFDHPLVIAGQATVGLEIVDEAPDAEVVLVPTGGGGLLAGIAAAMRASGSKARVIGVEPLRAASMQASLQAGGPVRLSSVSTMADGIAVRSPSQMTLEYAQKYVDEIVTVTEEEITRALLLLVERAKSVVEPAGAVGLAALLAGKVAGTGPALVVLSGGNVDPLLLIKILDYGLSVAGRYMMLRVLLEDRPGALASLSRAVADMHLNVLSVEHHRAGVSLGLDEVQVWMTVETRGHKHGDEIVARLSQAGFTVRRDS
ncbi:MAG: threonine ammonia-lyase [Actinomycetota bacterium]|nr:threonine ammonia-lyase [Actinomycetota bacterium]